MYHVGGKAPGSPAITPDIDIRDRFLDSEADNHGKYRISDIKFSLAPMHSGSIDQCKVTIYYW